MEKVDVQKKFPILWEIMENNKRSAYFPYPVEA